MAPDTPIPPEVLAAAAARAGQTTLCPRCNTQTPIGFAYCQQCGLHMSPQQMQQPAPVAPSPMATDPSGPPAGMRIRPPTAPQQVPVGQVPGMQTPRPQSGLASSGIEHGATIATDGVRSPLAGVPPQVNFNTPSGARPAQPRPASQPGAAAGPAWGQAVLVNRDGSDGQRFPLGGEYVIIGRAGADIAFDEDRFLARQHARLERGGDGAVKIAPLDALNGVFRKTDSPVELVDGMLILIGREVLRYERVDAEESKLHPLVRHGVALFGSPPREPWGRLLQIVPSGGYRDVRHLIGEEVVLGREEGDIVFRDDAFMSRRHAALTWDGKRAAITDLSSSNGTFVRITVPHAVKHGDHMRMGDQLLRIELGR